MTERKAWCLSLLPVLFFFISFFTYYYSYAIVQSYAGTSKSVKSHNSLCAGRLTQKKWESLDLNISRRTQLFLKLDDFFWREHLSTLPLPYGIKGSELQLLKVLAVTANYQMPANIDNLECRTCVVIGNSFAIKNTSLGGIIDKYDVVIRLNDAPVRGYEDDVGNKTTMRFFYPESASYNPGLNNQPGTLQIFVPFKQQDLLWLKEILYNEKRGRKGFWKPPPQIWLGDFAQIRVLDPHFLHQTAEKLLRIPLTPKSKRVRLRFSSFGSRHSVRQFGEEKQRLQSTCDLSTCFTARSPAGSHSCCLFAFTSPARHEPKLAGAAAGRSRMFGRQTQFKCSSVICKGSNYGR